ncbi:MAG: REP-associated tyrosine transposase [Halanaerobiales bacterium]|nr:REP-associated tyrosine transposase [Halanaerobiales bacterium]
MPDYRRNSHTISDIKYHIVWVTKYRYKVLKGEVAVRTRDLLRQICMSRDIIIIKGSVGRDHVHMLISCPTRLSSAKIIQYLKESSSRLLQEKFPHLRKRYWGQHLWARGYFCAIVGTVTEEMVSWPFLYIVVIGHEPYQ